MAARRAKRENGGLREDPPGSTMAYNRFFSQGSDVTDGSSPSEARKRGSGGGSPRKYDDLLTGPEGTP